MNCQLPWMAKCSVSDAVRRFIDSPPYTRTTIALQISAKKKSGKCHEWRQNRQCRTPWFGLGILNECMYRFPAFRWLRKYVKGPQKNIIFFSLSSVFLPQGYLLRLLLLFSTVQMLAVDIAVNSCGKRSSVKKIILEKRQLTLVRKERKKENRGEE